MAIRSWSLTKLWAVSACIWLAAASCTALSDYYDWPRIFILAFAFIPAFLAGAWAEHHPEIASWPWFRIATMWTITLAVGFSIADTIHFWRLPAALLGAPVVILTLRWYELTHGGRKLLPPPRTPSSSVPPNTPTGTPIAG